MPPLREESVHKLLGYIQVAGPLQEDGMQEMCAYSSARRLRKLDRRELKYWLELKAEEKRVNLELMQERYDFAANSVNGVILSAGSGPCREATYLSRRGVVVALDVDVEAVKACKGRLRGGVVRGDILHMPFRSGVFDAVVSLEVLEHVRGGLKALEEMQRVLKPEGVLVVSTPNRLRGRNLIALVTRGVRSLPLIHPDHVEEHSYWCLVRRLKELGFKVERVEGQNIPFIWLAGRVVKISEKLAKILAKYLPSIADIVLIRARLAS